MAEEKLEHNFLVSKSQVGETFGQREMNKLKTDIRLQIMSGRALRLFVTHMRTRPIMAATQPKLVLLEPYSSPLAPRNTLSTSSWLQNSLSDEDEVILLVGTTNNQSRMR